MLRLAVLAIVAVSACWALASPLGSIPDEPSHAVYAGAVVRGQLGSGPHGWDVRVPGALAGVSGTTCPSFRPDVTADCIEPVSGPDRAVPVVTWAGRYPPLYYAVVGWPTWFGFGDVTWYVMRLLSVALAGLLLWCGACAWRRDSSVTAAAALIAATPMTAYLAGSVNPNGAEIVAGIAFALGVTGLVDRWRHSPEHLHPRHAALAVLPGAYLALARPGSHLLALSLGAVLGLYALPDLRAMWRRRRALVVAPSAFLGASVALALAYRALLVPPPQLTSAPSLTWRAAEALTMRRAYGWLNETVGVFGWGDHIPPVQLQNAWLGLVAGLLVAGWFAARLRERLALLLLVVGAVLVGPYFAIVTLFKDGLGYQARYAMALTQAVPVLAAAVLAGRRAEREPDGLGRRVLAAVPGVCLVLGGLAMAGSMLRYAVGLPLPSNPVKALRDVSWVPSAWPLCLVLLGVAAWASYRLRRLLLSSGTEAAEVPGLP
jgi:hypothetical protein